MLRINRSESAPDYDVDDSPEISIGLLLQAARRQKWTIIFIMAIFAGLAALYCAAATPKYTAEAQLLIDAQQTRGYEVMPGITSSVDTAMIDSQVEILKSERIAKAVIKEMNLLEKEKDRHKAGGGFSLGSLASSALSFLFNQTPPSDYEIERGLIGSFARNLNVRRVAQSYVIDISYISPDPEEAANVANQLADAYIVDQLESKYQATRRAGIWMQERIADLREQAMAADRAVQEYKNENNIVDTGRGLVNDQQLTELNSQLISARTLVAEATARYNRVQDIIKEGTVSGVSNEAVSDVLNNEVITRLRSQLLDAQKREEEWSKRYGASHVAVVNLRSEIQGLKRGMFNELHRIAETYKSDLDIAHARKDSLEKSFNELVSQAKSSGNAQVKLRELESTAQSYRTLYDNFLQRFMQATQQQSFPITEARLITDASRPIRPTQPKTLLIVTGSLFLGLMVGTGVGYARERLNQSFRVPTDIEQYLDGDCLGVLARFTAAEPASAIKWGGFESASGPMREVVADPLSRFAETLRTVKVSADVSTLGKPIKSIGLISTLPKEGKTTISANLAQLIAHSGTRCILLDADLRNPSLTRRLTPDRKVGLLELLAGTATLDEVIVVDPLTGLQFIPVVIPRHVVHTNEIIASEAMAKLVASLRQRAEYIIFDLPPLAPVVDAVASSHFIDGFVYVIEWAKTPRNLVINILRTHRTIHEKVFGFLLNKADMSALRRLEEYGASYHYHKYYANYGQDN